MTKKRKRKKNTFSQSVFSHFKVLKNSYLCLVLHIVIYYFFCSGIQFNLLLSPYPCFISLLYLDLYVLGDDALIS